jgi:demethylmenaquinone methyltransferase/2-methoxy-6-polyprenyl-1,4-benzoquinol methylase
MMASPTGPGRRPDASRALTQYRRRAARYDLELLAFEPVRREAIALLELREGDTVLDVGCGTGLSFAALKQRTGPAGRIVAFDPSPEMLAHARARIAQHRWDGIELLEAAAENVPLDGNADAALFHFTHDVLRDARSLDHVFAHLRPGARVVASGLKWAPPWMAATNLFVWGAALYSVTCMAGLSEPWDLLAARLQDVQVRTRALGGIFVASGQVPASPRAPH